MLRRSGSRDLAVQPVIDSRVVEARRRLLRRRRPWLIALAAGSVLAYGPFIFGVLSGRDMPPYAFVLTVPGLAGLLAIAWLWPRLDRMAKRMQARPILQECPECGYATVSPEDGVCQECGALGLGRGDAGATGSGD